MKIHAASVDFALGRLIGGVEGNCLQQSARDLMTSEGVVDPAKFRPVRLKLGCLVKSQGKFCFGEPFPRAIVEDYTG